MQAISFKLGDYALRRRRRLHHEHAQQDHQGKKIGPSPMGFGLLFLGMTLMSDAIKPYRELLRPVMAGISADTTRGMLTGILLAVGLTAIIQSSGATIGMAFALVHAGVFTSIEQTMPIILGAHIGTCATALLASLRHQHQRQAPRLRPSALQRPQRNRRVLLKTPLLWVLTRTSADVVRQSANLHSR